MQNKVLLLDELGEKYGKTHIYHNLKTPAEGIRLLCINYPQLAKDLATSHEQGIFYKVTQVNQELSFDDLNLPIGCNDLVITPIISGSKGVVRALTGIALVVATGGFGAGFGTTLLGNTGLNAFGAAVASITAKVGVALMIGGVTEMLTPQPTLPSTIDFDGAFTNFTGGPGSLIKGANGIQSFAYTGPTNVSGLGKTIPVVYGKVLVGSLIVGASITPESENTTKSKFFRKAGKNTFTINSDKVGSKFVFVGGIVAKLFKKLSLKGGGRSYYKGKRKTLALDKSEQEITTTALNGNVVASKDGPHGTKKYGIAFFIKGLIDRVGSPTSTFIDGFITFQVIIKENESRDIVGRHQITIRGLLTPSNAHRVGFLVKFPFAFFPDKEQYKVFVQLIDFSVLDSCVFQVIEHGMGLQ
tara:strand:- start:903 stop:2144 length:1242 start_codon:yes stop_codon:yes gene_type:complete